MTVAPDPPSPAEHKASCVTCQAGGECGELAAVVFGWRQSLSPVSEDWDDIPEDHVSFVDCTCDHDPDEHGWGSCDVEGCPCEGGWEE